jgi:hypothetical protein
MATSSREPLPTPNSRSELVQFIEAARQQGASDEFISRLLKSFGWSPREIERAFYIVFERLTNQPIPAPQGGTGEVPRDAFIYLLSFSTLALWTQALGEMAFIFIDRLIPNPVDRYYGNLSSQVAFCLARLMVAYPVYLLLMRQSLTELSTYREKSYSGVRKWLTYLTLLIVSLIAIGTIISFLSSFLHGELTLRFVLKVLVVLAIDGSVLWYYAVWLQRRPTPLR